MRPFILITFICTSLILSLSCKDRAQLNYSELEAIVQGDTIRCVIEIPAGTNKKIEYNDTENEFRVDVRNGQDRVISFLPYPANYGFIPSTEASIADGGDGDHLDVVVLAESVKTGTVIEVVPIAVLKLLDNNERDFKIIGVPTEADKQVVKAYSLMELQKNYPAVIEILGSWFTNYDKSDDLEILGWGDEIESMKEIKMSIRANQ